MPDDPNVIKNECLVKTKYGDYMFALNKTMAKLVGYDSRGRRNSPYRGNVPQGQKGMGEERAVPRR